MTNQSDRQESVRALTGTSLNYEGDWHALFDLDSIPAGSFNGRLLGWINQKLTTSYTELNGAMAAFAAANGSNSWNQLGSFSVNPYPTSGLSIWYDAADTSSIAQISNNVSQINDKSGNGYHATQGTLINQPLTASETINSRNTLVFNGSSTFLNIPSGAYGLTNGDYTIYSVAANRVSSAAGCLYHFNQAPVIVDGTYYRYDFSNTVIQFAAGSSSANSFSYTANTLPNIGVLIKNGAVGSAYRNAQTGTNVTGTNFTCGQIRIGSFTENTNFVNIRFAEFLVYNRVIANGSADDLQIRAALTSKWAI